MTTPTHRTVPPGGLAAAGEARRAVVVAHHRRSVRAVAERVLGACWYIGVWFWAIALVITGIMLVVQTRVDGVEVDALNGPAGSARFFLFVMGILLPLVFVAVHVAAGGTRRAFVQGLWAGAVAAGVSFGAAATLVAWLVDVVARRAGWDALVADQLYDDGSQVGVVLVVQVLSCTVYTLTGMAVGAAYHRGGGWRGTFLLPLVLLPVALAEAALRSGFFGGSLAAALGVGDGSVVLAVGGGLLATALAALALHLTLRDAPLRPVSA